MSTSMSPHSVKKEDPDDDFVDVTGSNDDVISTHEESSEKTSSPFSMAYDTVLTKLMHKEPFQNYVLNFSEF